MLRARLLYLQTCGSPDSFAVQCHHLLSLACAQSACHPVPSLVIEDHISMSTPFFLPSVESMGTFTPWEQTPVWVCISLDTHSRPGDGAGSQSLTGPQQD